MAPGLESEPVFELDRYLDRIGADRGASLAELHRAHATSIVFEGLSAHLGEGVPLDPDALAAKLVDRGRGGYCFEQNLLFKAALEELGYEVDPYLARVRVGLAPGQIRGRTHLVLRVGDGERRWHADVGFGSGTLTEPIPWGPGAEHEQAGWRFRAVKDGDETVLQTFDDDGWADLYAFIAQPAPMIDIEMNNWWTATHPDSPFVTGVLVSRQWPDGRRLILSDWGELSLLDRTPSQSSAMPVAREDVPALLAERFGLGGFELAGDGRLRLGWR
jgi:N-hydroxyarylamine O-acetyltransferase